MFETTKLLTYREAAEALTIGKSTISELVKRGELTVVRLGPQTVRIPADEVAAFIKSRTEHAKARPQKPSARQHASASAA